jgi:CRISPR-associated protein Csb2
LFAVRIEYLTGRCVATAFNDRRQAEWPPHPARFFSALVAEWAAAAPGNAATAATPADAPHPGSVEERRALEWLEAQEPPGIVASDADPRTTVPTFVPVNDTTVIDTPSARLEANLESARAAVATAREELVAAEGAGDRKAAAKASKVLARAETQLAKLEQQRRDHLTSAIQPLANASATSVKAAREVLPDRRSRQPRFFPSVAPTDPVVWFVWENAPPAAIRPALDRLVRRVTRLGHSASLVSATVVDTAPPARFVPDPSGALVLRTPGSGLLALLEAEHRRHRGQEPRVLPCRFVRYREVTPGVARPAAARGVFSADWIVLRRIGGPRLPSTATVAVANAVRGALLTHADQPPPRILSGHEADGTPAGGPHLAIVPLPFVGHRQADGALLGVALVLPAACSPAEREAVLRALGRWEQTRRGDSGDEETPTLELRLGAAGVLEVERVAWGEPAQSTLQGATWCRPSRVWRTATPIALDRNPGNLYAADPHEAEAAYRQAEAIIADSCRNVGLPAPAAVTVLPSVSLAGTTKARDFPPFPNQPGRIRRVRVHAELRFTEPVAGPLLLGAGRYLGLGLLRPLDEGNA